MKQHGLKGHQVQESKGAIFIPMVSSKAKIPSKSRSKLLSPKACGAILGQHRRVETRYEKHCIEEVKAMVAMVVVMMVIMMMLMMILMPQPQCP